MRKIFFINFFVEIFSKPRFFQIHRGTEQRRIWYFVLFILCTGINNTNYDETLLLSILSKFKLTSLVVGVGNSDENIVKSLLQMPSIQETLEHFEINNLYLSKCSSVVELLIEFKRIKKVEIRWSCIKNYVGDDKLEECKLEFEQFVKKLKEKHSEIEIKICEYFDIFDHLDH